MISQELEKKLDDLVREWIAAEPYGKERMAIGSTIVDAIFRRPKELRYGAGVFH